MIEKHGKIICSLRKSCTVKAQDKNLNLPVAHCCTRLVLSDAKPLAG